MSDGQTLLTSFGHTEDFNFKMKISIIIAALAVTACLGTAVREEKEEDKRAVLTAALAVTAAAGVMKSIASFIGGLNGPDNVKDTVVNGRALRIVVDDTNGCATVTDRDLGYKSTKCTGNSAQATAVATEELFGLLIHLGQFSEDDLHHRPKPVTRPPTLCKDTISSTKCAYHIKIGHCHIGSTYFHWMHENCFRSCAACNPLEKIFPNKPAATAPAAPAGY